MSNPQMHESLEEVSSAIRAELERASIIIDPILAEGGVTLTRKNIDSVMGSMHQNILDRHPDIDERVVVEMIKTYKANEMYQFIRGESADRRSNLKYAPVDAETAKALQDMGFEVDVDVEEVEES